MILAAIVLFSLAATLGFSLIVLGVRYQRSSLSLGAGHAGTAVLGLTLLGWQLFNGPVHMLYNDAALLFIFALLGGVVLLALRIQERGQRRPPPMVVVSLHAVMAVLGLLLLLAGYMHR